MKVLQIQSDSRSSTLAFGEKIGKYAKKGMVILLSGDLGAGKTALTEGIAKGLDIARQVTSPTFNILKIYHGRMPLYHIDAYRLEGMEQDLGFNEFLEDDGLTVIEWPQFVPYLIPAHALQITINLQEGDRRALLLQADGEVYEQFLEELQ